LDGDRTLEKGYRQDEAFSPSDGHQDSLNAAKWPLLDSDPLPHLQIRAGGTAQPSSDGNLDRGQFGIVNRYRSPSNCNGVDNPGDGKDWQPVQGVKAGKNVARKKRKFKLLKSVGPSAAALIRGQKCFKAPRPKVGYNSIFVMASYP
jgi:hypothetical protein